MSGGHFDYKEYSISYIADEIERIIATNNDEGRDSFGDRIGYGFSPETIEEFKIAADLLRKAFIYVHEIDFLICGDTSEDSFHENLETELDKLK